MIGVFNKIRIFIVYYITIICFKLRHRKNCDISWKSRIIKFSTHVDCSGYLCIKEGANCRNNLSIVVQGGSLIIGEKCFFNNNCSIICLEKIEIGANSTFGPNVVIVDHDHNYKKSNGEKFIKSEIKIGKNVWIGSNVVILRGVTIGDNSVVAAGSIVNKDIPNNTLFYQKRESIIQHFI